MLPAGAPSPSGDLTADPSPRFFRYRTVHTRTRKKRPAWGGRAQLHLGLGPLSAGGNITSDPEGSLLLCRFCPLLRPLLHLLPGPWETRLHRKPQISDIILQIYMHSLFYGTIRGLPVTFYGCCVCNCSSAPLIFHYPETVNAHFSNSLNASKKPPIQESSLIESRCERLVNTFVSPRRITQPLLFSL